MTMAGISDDELLAKASEYTGIFDQDSVIRLALETLVQVEAGRGLIALGGTDPDAWAAPRRRAEPA
jgi:hypothetical protein